MNTIAAIGLCGAAAGLVAGLALVWGASAETRFAVEAHCLRFGIGASVLMLVWWLVAEQRADPRVEFALGAIAFGTFVAGAVLSIARERRSRS